MDSQSEQALIARLEAELADRTALFVTHRMPLLSLVSRIILMDRGRVVADGPRNEILRQLGGNGVRHDG